LTFGIGKVLLFLIPGLFVYSCLFGLFGLPSRNKAFRAPAPPANSVKAATIILVSALGVHLLTLSTAMAAQAFIGVMHWLCPGLPALEGDVLAALTGAFRVPASPSASAVLLVLALSLAEGLLAYWLVGRWLQQRAKADNLLRWLYGWTAPFANASDEDNRILWAVALTDQDVAWQPYRDRNCPKSVLYAGIVDDLALDADGNILRLNLTDCERYVVDMTASIIDLDMEPLSYFSYLSLERSRIRNVTFELLER
jgi:hypothetical protein